jgi:hypothetical protein
MDGSQNRLEIHMGMSGNRNDLLGECTVFGKYVVFPTVKKGGIELGTLRLRLFSIPSVRYDTPQASERRGHRIGCAVVPRHVT